MARAYKMGAFLQPMSSLTGHSGCEYGQNVTKLVGCGW